MPFELKKQVLLTGAGFTCNFGGFLAKQMWALIFNCKEVQANGVLKNILKDDFNYESVFQKVLCREYTSELKEAMKASVNNAYGHLDEVIRGYRGLPTSSYPIHIHGVSKLLNRFAGEGSERGYFFTLNQDLFIERWCIGDEPLQVPGFRSHLPGLSSNRSRPLTQEDIVSVPTADTLSGFITKDAASVSSSGRFHYVKLHGSMNWRTSDGSNAMVIGGDKLEQISKEPILKWYFETFERVLSRRDRRLLIIGYGFRDPHVNEIISRAIENNGLRWYVISPMDPELFKEELYNQPNGKKLWGGLAGYFPYMLKDVYPADQTQTVAAKEILSAIFS